MRYFCTYFDHRYLSRGIALYRSLKTYARPFRLWVLCMDDHCHAALSQLALPDLQPIRLRDFEHGDTELIRAKQNRSLVEYYFTCTPSLPRFIFHQWQEVDRITYIDADVRFYSSPEVVFDEIGLASVAIVGHRFPPKLKYLEQVGIYNVGWLTFRRDDRGIVCLQWWRDRCIEWCYDRCEDGKFADQKYLDDWPTRFDSVAVIQHKGANLAPWNLGNYKIRWDDEQFWVDQEKLIFYHFHGLKRFNGPFYHLNLAPYETTANRAVIRRLYAPYLRELLRIDEEIEPLVQGHVVDRSVRLSGLKGDRRIRKPPSHWVMRLLMLLVGLLRGNFLLAIGKRVL